MKRLALLSFGILLGASACSQPADVVSENLSTAADNFELERRIIFYNGITDTYMLEIEGRCSLGNDDPPGKLTVTCQTGDDEYKKHFLGLSDNVTYFVEQIDGADVSEYNYRVVFRPETIRSDIEVDIDAFSGDDTNEVEEAVEE